MVVAGIVTVLAIAAAVEVVPLWRQRRDLKAEVENLTEKLRQAQDDTARAQSQLTAAEARLNGLREASYYVANGINEVHARNFRAAISQYDQALEIDPHDPYVLNLKGVAFYKLKDYDNAIATLNSAAAADPSYARYLFDLARAYCAAEKFPDAEQAFHRAVSLRPTMLYTAGSDESFRRTCRPIVQQLKLPHVPKKEQQKYLLQGMPCE